MKKFKRLAILVFLVGQFFQSFSQTFENYYITFAQEPWNNPSNSMAMDDAFGSGNWKRRYFTDTDLASLFTSATKFIFVDGSAGVTSQFNTFLQNHHDAFTGWVAAGGHLFINCGPDAEQNFGFDGTLGNEAMTVLAENENAQVVGPILSLVYDLSSQVEYTGTGFAHAKISGSGLRPLITTGNGSAVVLADQIYGNGLLLFGGLTTNNFHQPKPQAAQLTANILYYAARFNNSTPPEANFTTNSSNPYVNNTTTLSDASSGYVTERTWRITPITHEYVNGTNEHSYRPVIRFRETGPYAVTLTVSNDQGENSKTIENYITVNDRRKFYWVGGDGWIGDSHWATTSGGSELYSEVPSVNDIAIFDENSFSAEGQQILLDGDVSVYDLTISGTTQIPEFLDGSFSIEGSLTITTPVILDDIVFFLGSDDHATIDLSGLQLTGTNDHEITINGTGSFDFVSSFGTRQLTIYNGTVSARGITIVTEEFFVEAGLPVSVDLATSELLVTEYLAVWRDVGSPFTSDFKLLLGLEGNYSYLEGFLGEGDLTLNDATLSGNVTLFNAVTFKKLTITPGASVDFYENTETVEQIDIRGTAEDPITLTNGVLKKTSGNVVGSYLALTDLEAAGGASFYADKHSIDNGGNTGWIFSTKEAQVIDFPAISNKAYGVEPFPVTATSTSGLPVAITVVSGPATISGEMVTITGVGNVIVQADQEGDDSFLPAQEVFQSFTVKKAGQNMNFTIGDLTFGDGPVTINTTPGESGNDVTFSVESGPATVSGNVLTITGAGNIIVKAVQKGNDNYLTATVSKEISIAKALQNIVFTSIPDKTFGDAAFDIIASGGVSGNPVVFSVTAGPATIEDSTVTLTGAGTVTIKASQSGGANYVDADAEQTFSVAKGTQEITFNPIPDKTFGDAAFTVSVSGGASGNPVVFSVTSGPAMIEDSTITLTGAGTVTIKASQEGGDNYLDVDAEQTFSVAKGVQEITFNPIPDKTFGDAAFEVSTTGGASGNPVVLSVTSGPATIEGSIVTLTGTGPVAIEAFQAGNDNYIEALAEQTFCVNPEKPSITVTGSDTEAPILTSTGAEGYQWYNSGVAISGANGNTHMVTEAGIYTVTVSASGCVSVPSEAHVLIVTAIEGARETIVKMYPNPAVNELIVDLTAVNLHQEISVMLYDVSGRLMDAASGRGFVAIPMQSYRPGQYAVVVHFDKQRMTKHIVKK